MRRQQGTVDRELAPLNALFSDYIDKARVLADKLQLPHEGTEVWSEGHGYKANNKEAPMIRVADAFARILDDIPVAGNKHDGGTSISVQEMDAALQKLQVEATLYGQELATLPASPIMASGHDFALDQNFTDMFNATQMSPDLATDTNDTACVDADHTDGAEDGRDTHPPRC